MSTTTPEVTATEESPSDNPPCKATETVFLGPRHKADLQCTRHKQDHGNFHNVYETADGTNIVIQVRYMWRGEYEG